jgi:hypothetical protein
MSDTELVSYAQAAAMLGVPTSTLVWLVARDRVEIFRAAYGRQARRYVRRQDVEKLAEGEGWRRRQPPATKRGSR